MSEEKKPKIDLKARLGKAAPAGAAVPVPTPAGAGPATPSGAPVPMPAPGSIPAPAFAQPAAAASTPPAGPPVDTSDPFAVVAAPAGSPAASQPQTIKIEVGEEFVAEQAKTKKKLAVFATLSAVVGLGLGFVWGGRSADQRGAERAVRDASLLAGDVEKAQEKAKALSELIAGAVKEMSEKKYPEKFANELGGLSIPFGGEKLAGKNIGRFDPKVAQALLDYAGDIETLNKRKDALKNLFVGQKAAIVDALGAADSPKVTFAVFVQKSQAHGPVAILAPLVQTDRFAYKEANWPAKFKVSTGREAVETEKYGSGDVFSNPPKIVTIPIDPDSIATSFPTDVIVKMKSELMKTGEVLAGRAGATPDDEEEGLLKKGEKLVVGLKKIGSK